MQHRAATDFWQQYHALSHEARARADKQFSLLKANPQHPSLQFKKVGDRRSLAIMTEIARLEQAAGIEGRGATLVLHSP